MEIKTIVSGELNNNTYVVLNNQKAIIVDASAEVSLIDDVLDGREVEGVLLSHAHFDHIENLKEILKKYNCKCFLSSSAVPKLSDAHLNASYLSSPFTVDIPEDSLCIVKDEDNLTLADLEIKVIELKGHTDCGLGFVIEDVVFSGDTMFSDGYGRTDLPTSDFTSLVASLKKLMKNYKGYKLLSGHGPEGII